MAVEQTEIALSVSGEEATARAMENVAKKMEGVARASKNVADASKATTKATAEVAAATEQLTPATTRATAGFAKFGPAIGIVAQGLGSMNGAAGQSVQVLGAAAGAVAGLTSAFGPLGLAIGVASAAFTIYQKIVGDAAERTKELAQRQEQAREAATRLALANSLEGRTRALLDANEAQRTRNELLSTEEGLQVRILDVTQQINSLGGGFSGSFTGRDAGRIGELESQRSELQRQLAEAIRKREREERGGGGGRRPERADESSLAPVVRDDWYNNTAPTVGELADAERAAFDRNAEGKLAAQNQQRDVQLAAEAAEAQRRYNQINAEGLRIAQDRSKEREREIEQLSQVTDMWGNLAGVMAGSVAGALEAVAKGEMSLGQAFRKVIAERLKGTAIEESVLALVSLAKAASLSVWNPAGAAQELTAAALHGQAAAMAGAGAGIAYAIGSGGGGGGGGKSSAAPSSQPTRDTSAQASGDGGRVINITFGSPVVTASTIAELGRELKTAIVTAEARGWA